MLKLAEPQEQRRVGTATGQMRPVLAARGVEGGRRKMAAMPPSFPRTMGCTCISPRGGCISLWTSKWVLNDAAHPEVPWKREWAQRSWQDLAYLIPRALEILSHCGKNLLCFLPYWVLVTLQVLTDLQRCGSRVAPAYSSWETQGDAMELSSYWRGGN